MVLVASSEVFSSYRRLCVNSKGSYEIAQAQQSLQYLPCFRSFSNNNFYGHSLPSADSRRAVFSYWQKNGHLVPVKLPMRLAQE